MKWFAVMHPEVYQDTLTMLRKAVSYWHSWRRPWMMLKGWRTESIREIEKTLENNPECGTSLPVN